MALAWRAVNNFSSKILKNLTPNGLKLQQQSLNVWHTQSFRGYADVPCNRVDAERLKIVGPDRLCAEWVLKNGGKIRTVEDQGRILKDCNTLSSEKDFKIKSIDASGSSIMKMGFDHLKGCKHIDTVILHECEHLEGLDGITHLKDTLKELEVSACDNINDADLMVIGELKNLDFLKMFQMRYVKNIYNIRQALTDKIPKCSMDINF